MNQTKLGKIVLAGIGLVSHLSDSSLAQTSAEVGAVEASESTTTNDQLQERLVVEGDWIKVPLRCKDRSFSSEPQVIEREALSPAMASMHALIIGE